MKKITQFAQLTDLSDFVIDERNADIRIYIDDASKFERDSLRTIPLTFGIQAVIGRKVGTETTKVQTLLFDKLQYSSDQAQTWIKRHHGQLDKALELEHAKKAVFEGSGYDIATEDVKDVLEEHLIYHLPPLKPSGIEKIIRVCGLLPSDMMEYMFDNVPPPEPETSDNDIYDILKMTPEQMDARIRQIDEMIVKLQQ